MYPLNIPIVREVSSPTLHRAAGSLHVDPQEVLEERLLEVVVDA